MDKMQNTIASGTLMAVYIELAADDPENNIPNILKSNFESYTKASQFQTMFFSLLCASENFQPNIAQLTSKAQALQSVCAKTLTHHDIAWKCETWELDPTCIIWAECFEKSNHEGHKIRLQRGAAGCCDCGDPTAWQSSGFCSDHQGYKEYTDQEVRNMLPKGMGERWQVLFAALGEFLHSKLLACETATTNIQAIKGQIMGVLGWISSWLEISPVFIHYLTKMFMSIHPHIDTTSHEWVPLAFVDEDHQEIWEQLINSNDNNTNEEEKHQCRCTLMSQIFKLTDSTFYTILSDAIIFKMFQSLKFKTVLGLSYIANMKHLLSSSDHNNSLIHFGVQILTIPEIALKIFQNDLLRETIFNHLEDLSNITKSTEENNKRKFYWFITDMKYLLKGPVIDFLLHNDGIEKIMHIFGQLCMIDAIKMRDEHIFLDTEGYFFDGLDYSYMLLKVGYTLIKEIDYTDIEFNQKIASLFQTYITPLHDAWEDNK